ncbi:GNAT family N-acetyltransferase [Paenibacillus humicola]|uniref:GNAT family N-acetyltransferase n=1 Tax=Paenibacillus humicola TaxID=3110540 RepID=UPI00237A806D|nr:GNAT family N-acetyltransferase [Paenibacillus humicola]
MAYKLDIVLETQPDLSIFLNNMIKEFNNKHSVHHLEKRKQGAVQPINIMVSDDNHNWVGGLTAEVYWNWLEVNYLWVHEDDRGEGLGSTLLEKAEGIAKQKGAVQAKLATFDFQARSFYECKGYKVVGEIKDYPPGSSFYIMVKVL